MYKYSKISGKFQIVIDLRLTKKNPTFLALGIVAFQLEKPLISDQPAYSLRLLKKRHHKALLPLFLDSLRGRVF